MKEMINLMPEMEAIKADAENLFKKVTEIITKEKIHKVHDIACYWLTSDDCDSALSEIIQVCKDALERGKDPEKCMTIIEELYEDIEPEYSTAFAEIKDVLVKRKK